MTKNACYVFATTALLSCCAMAGPAPKDAAPLDAAQALRELDSLAKVRDQQAGKNFLNRKDALEAAAAGGSSASDVYKKAVQALHVGSNSDFADWSRDQADMLRSEMMQNSIALHARYLLLGMRARRADGKADDSGDDTARQCLAYAKQLSAFLAERDGAAKAPKEAKELLDKPFREAVFARWLGLADYLPGKEQWEEKPGNLEGILEKNVRIPMRAKKDSALLGAWDLQIEFLRARASQASEAAKATINETDLPRAFYGRALDKKLLGMRNAFLRDTLALAKQHPGHPDWDKWTKSLRDELVITGSAPEPESETPASVPARE